MKERIALIRKNAKLTQEEFGNAIGVSKNTIQGYEYGKRNVTDRTIRDICSKFHVNEEWLRYENGDIYFEDSVETKIADLIELMQAEPNSLKMRLIDVIARLNDEEIAWLQNIIDELANGNE